ncbi:sensor domain-containing diguanylate cyclase [Consotaella salsifontis]|uniref:diguanylate cyclase n=1 Tax=Consotaella salsifontis TaxID=1365950 RepID=A0A1T4LSE7_9HYPH|nr:sensor domain-containing diguanylate cyclase [Consotaella salsifontis]SJZ57561.1 PAS domain S-box-containing protein/diguanylate cyclase (GGDEF) domain-containing protein [Consotaella salsifontis]
MAAEGNVEQVLLSALAETERRFRLVSDESPVMIWICGSSGERHFVNRAWRNYLGVPDKEPDEIDWMSFVHPDDRIAYKEMMDDLLAEPRRGEVEFRVMRPCGEWGWIQERIIPRQDSNRSYGLMAAAADVTLVKQSEELLSQAKQRMETEVRRRTRHLQKMTLTDALTGIANRRHLFDQLASEIGGQRQEPSDVSLLYIDIDRFKDINDRLGHPIGDEVLIAVARALQRQIGKGGFVGRVGGEEFVVILPGASPQMAKDLAESVRTAVSRLCIASVGHPVTVSIGIASRWPEEPAEDLVRRADEALLRAKQNGRNCCVPFAGEPALA